MIYLIFIIVSVLSIVFIDVICSVKGVVDPGLKIKIYKKIEGVEPFSGKTLTLISIVCFILTVIIQISLYKNTNLIGFIKLYGLLLLVIGAALVDYKRKIIPNLIIIIGLIFRVLIYSYEIFFTKDIKTVFINDLIGLAIGFGILAFVSVITKGSIGMGDAKLFGIIGIISGSFCTYSTLLVSLFASAIVSVIGMLRKKMKRKDSIAFGPCIAIGYIVSLLLTSY